MGPDDAIDALSSDFTCSSPAAGGKETEEEVLFPMLLVELVRNPLEL